MAGYEIRMSDSSKGKALYATKYYEPGDIILEEEPVVSCQFAWNKSYKYLACDNCMWPLETPEQNVRRLSSNPDIILPYPECYDAKLDQTVSCGQCRALYCSEICRQKAFASYHKTLCYDEKDTNHPIAVLVESWKQMHYPPETMNVMLILRILAFIKQSANPDASAAAIKRFCHRTVNEDAELVHYLLGDQFANQLSTLRELTANCISGEEIQEFLTPEGFCSFLALIGTNGQGIGTSPLAMWANTITNMKMGEEDRIQIDTVIKNIYELVENESGTFLNTEGSGLYTLQSAANHSCAPNAQCTFPYNNHRLQMKAIKEINPGDEIFISYLDECALSRSRHSRQKELAQNYLFVCRCELCLAQSSQPDCTSEEDEDSDSDNNMEAD